MFRICYESVCHIALARQKALRKRMEEEERKRRKAEETRKTYEKYTLKKTLQGHTNWVRALAIYKDTIISGSYKEIKLWDLDKPRYSSHT